MKQEDITSKLQSFLSTFRSVLDEYSDIVPGEYATRVSQRLATINDDYNRMQDKDRKLTIGIVGSVKAGKTSFVNSLIFDGRDVLPKAATPMTAALTTIEYSETPYVKIVFYTASDWEGVKAMAYEYTQYEEKKKEYDDKMREYTAALRESKMPRQRIARPQIICPTKPSFSVESCHKLIREAQNKMSDAEIFEALGREERLEGDVYSYLSEYCGAGGKYSAVVKQVELYINEPKLKEFRIVDTPGLNDPILSRSEVTKRELHKCDVVFLVSMLSKFLDNNDLDLLQNSLPVEGIKRAVLIGSQLDSVMLEEGRDGRTGDFKVDLDNTVRRLKKQATDTLIRSDLKQHTDSVDGILNDENGIICTCALYFSVAQAILNNTPISSEGNHTINELIRRYPTIKDKLHDPDYLLEFSGISKVNQLLDSIRADKAKTLSEKSASFVQTYIGKIRGDIDELRKTILDKLDTLTTGDVGALRRQYEMLTSKLESIRVEVASLFTQEVVAIKRRLNSIMPILIQEAEAFDTLEVKKSTSSTTKESTSGMWFWKKTHYKTTTIDKYTASVSEVLHNIRSFVGRANEIVNDQFNALSSQDKLKAQLIERVKGAYDMSSADFLPTTILVPVNDAFAKISLPQISIEYRKYETEITEKFQESSSSSGGWSFFGSRTSGHQDLGEGGVEGYDVDKLKITQTQTLHMLIDSFDDEIKKNAVEIERMLNDISKTFVSDILSDMKKGMEDMERQLADRDKSIAQCKSFIEKLDETDAQVNDIQKQKGGLS